MRKVAAVMLVLLMLSGCMVGPDYKRPSLDIPRSWRVEETEARAVANTSWWEQFGDPVLDGLIAEAIRENYDLKVASYRVEEYGGLLMTTRASLFPQVGANASAEGLRLSEKGQIPVSSSAKNPVSVFSASLNASWEIDLWGKLRRATEAARADMLGTVEARDGVILSLVTAVAGAYVGLRDLDSQLDIAVRTANSREETQRLFTRQFKSGIISELELSQATSQYEQALAVIPPLKRAIEQQENALCLLLGRNPGPIARGKSIDELGLPAVPEGLPSDLLERRPDIRQAEQALIAANARIGVAKALYFPSISLTGAFGWSSTSLTSLFTGPARTWSAAGSAIQPIFTAGAIKGQVKSATAVEEETLNLYKKAVQSAFTDVDNALIAQRRTREQLEVQARRVASLRTYARVARLRYDIGQTSYIDVLDAERSLFVAELAFAQTKGDLFQALVDLYKAMGGGWVAVADGRVAVSPRTGP